MIMQKVCVWVDLDLLENKGDFGDGGKNHLQVE